MQGKYLLYISLILFTSRCSAFERGGIVSPAAARVITSIQNNTVINPSELVWSGYRAALPETVYFRHTFTPGDDAASAYLQISTNSPFSVWVNGNLLDTHAASFNPSLPLSSQIIGPLYITRYLHPDQNILAIKCVKSEGNGALWYRINVKLADGRSIIWTSGKKTRTSHVYHDGWNNINYNDHAWGAADISHVSLKNKTTVIAKQSDPPAISPVVSWDAGKIVRIWKNAIPASGMSINNGMHITQYVYDPEQKAIPGIVSSGFELFMSASSPLKPMENAPNIWDFHTTDALHNQADIWKSLWGMDFQLSFPPAWYYNEEPFTRIQCIYPSLRFQAFSPWDMRSALYSTHVFSRISQKYPGRTLAAAHLSILPDIDRYPGYWCNDPLALSRFQNAMYAKYAGIDLLNNAWGTYYKSKEDIPFPTSEASVAPRNWLDFAEWYQNGLGAFADMQAKIFRRYYPDTPLTFTVTHSDDISLLARIAVRYHAGLEVALTDTPQLTNHSRLFLDRVGSACRYYNVPLWVRNTASISSNEEVWRFFLTASEGAAFYGDTPVNISKASSTYSKFGKYLEQGKPKTDIAVFYPTSSRLLFGDQKLKQLEQGCERLRPSIQYDILDESMIREGALKNYRMLVFLDSPIVESDTLLAIHSWVEQGGTVCSYNSGKTTTPDGSSLEYLEIFGFGRKLSPAYQEADISPDSLTSGEIHSLKSEWSHPLGSGLVVFYPAGSEQLNRYCDIIKYLADHLSTIDPSKKDGVSPGSAQDGLYATLFSDHLLCYNASDSLINRSFVIPGRLIASANSSDVPHDLNITIRLGPHSIVSIPFDKPDQELLLQCEKFTNIENQKTLAGDAYSPGRGITSVLVKSGSEISTRFECVYSGKYTIFYRAIRAGKLARAQVFLDGVKITSEQISAQTPAQQTILAGDATLSRGVHVLTIRPMKGEDIRADFVIVANNPAIAGYGFGVSK
jgi:hypothetical protein